jgi:class 3 adenylate cyclase
MIGSENRCPVVYGEPAQVVALLESVARLMALEPVEVWADAGVRRSVSQLSALATRRMAEASAPLRARPAWRPLDVRVAS